MTSITHVVAVRKNMKRYKVPKLCFIYIICGLAGSDPMQIIICPVKGIARSLLKPVDIVIINGTDLKHCYKNGFIIKKTSLQK